MNFKKTPAKLKRFTFCKKKVLKPRWYWIEGAVKRLHFFVETFVVCCRKLCLQLKCVCDNFTTRRSIDSPNSSKTLSFHMKMYNSEPPRYTWRSTCRTFVYVTSVTWQAFTRRNYCVTHDCVTSMCVKCIWMTKVSKSWRNKTMTHINKTRITLTWRHKYINSTHVTHKNNYMTYHYMT